MGTLLDADDKRPVQFNRDVRPILSDNCFACHGPDPGSRKEGLRLDQEAGLFGDRKGGKAVIKGDAEKSIVYQRIVTKDEDDIMPPPASHKSLTAEQKETIRKWIAQGAPWESHWSLITPRRSAVPGVTNPQFPIRNPIDAFILARLIDAGLSPAPEADRRTLIRRLALDLTGLPPTPQDVEAFVNDKSPNAYEKAVDRLLGSPHYGEHRARYWLDAARYADTHGLHFDNYREIWPYREWVINSFNSNMPFDRFTIEQLAGDLLPNATYDQRIASGFHRCQTTTNEGGTIAEENLVFYTRDRTETTGRVWMGLTVNCAVCHDHKFDPITMRDFYSMSAFFNNSQVGALDGNIKDSPPVLVVTRSEDRPRYEKLTAEIATAKAAMEQRRKEARSEFDKWLATATPESIKQGPSPAELRLHAMLNEGTGSTTRVMVDGTSRQVPLAPTTKWQAGQISPKAIQGPAGEIAQIVDAGNFDRNQPFTAAVWAKLPAKNTTGAVIARMSEQENFRGWDLWVQGDRIGSHIIHRWQDDAVKVVSNKAVDVNKWHHLALTWDGSGKASGLKIYIDGEPQPTRVEADTLKGTTRTEVPFKIGQRNGTSPIKGLAVNDLRLYGRALSAGEIKQIANSTRLTTLLAKAADKRTEPEKKELFDWYLGTSDAPTRELTSQMAGLESEAAQIKGRSALSLVMAEKPDKPKAWILFRGEYDKRRDEVGPGTPAAMPEFPKDAPQNRLGLAQWLLRAEHPLTARVTVNRLWQEIFGTGLVKTTEDFGIMGELPSHPELLDWLAVEFREGGWDVKKTIKLMVMSSAYRQSAAATPEKIEKDPANRLLSRGPRFRMDAEVIRDSALAASGLLIPKIGGPSVRPYQPPGVWEAVAMIGSNTRDYKADTGENLYRRSLYTFWKRSAPPASMDIFNAPSREVCTVRRERTNTPLQALVTMNDPQFVEAARVLAQAAIKEGGAGFDGRLDLVSGRLLARPMSPAERGVLQGAFNDLLGHYRQNEADAKQLLAVGESKRDEALNAAEHAAWTMLVNQMMNLDECLNK